MYELFHIGIPKSGTTTIQEVLNNDPRLHISRSRYFTSSDWWNHPKPKLPLNKICVVSNETLISSGFQKVKFIQVIERLYKTNKNAHIIITMRQQQDALCSMFKYHILHNFKGTKSFSNWMYHTNLGMDYISLCMYGNIAKILQTYFPKEQIHFLFFEELKEDPSTFYEKFYKIIGLPFEETSMILRKLNAMPYSTDKLYTLNRLNRLSIFKKGDSRKLSLKKIASIEQKIKRTLLKFITFRKPQHFFKIEDIPAYNELHSEFAHTNNVLISMKFVTKKEFEKYNYSI